MTDQERFGYIMERLGVLRADVATNTYRATGAEDSNDALLWDAIKLFASALYNKAKLARDKYDFHPLGWVYPDWQAELQKGIAEHLLKGDPRDVAVYAMFAWFHGWPTAAALPLGGVVAAEQVSQDELGRFLRLSKAFDEAKANPRSDSYGAGERIERNVVPHLTSLLAELAERRVAAPAPAVSVGGASADEVKLAVRRALTEQEAEAHGSLRYLAGTVGVGSGGTFTDRIVAGFQAIEKDLKEATDRAVKAEAALSAPAASVVGVDAADAGDAQMQSSRFSAAIDYIGEVQDALTLAQHEADKEEPNDGYERLYNVADEVQACLNQLAKMLTTAPAPALSPIGVDAAELSHRHYWIECFVMSRLYDEEMWELAVGTRNREDVPHLLAQFQARQPEATQWRVREEGRYDHTWPALPAARSLTIQEGPSNE